MSPEDLSLIRSDAAVVGADPDAFATIFYDALFDLAPEVRTMFPVDLTEQRRKLMTELTTIVRFGTSAVEGDLDRFLERARSLGHRHVEYGAEAAHYPVVGTALLSAFAESIPGWDDDHERAWATVYRLVADTMLEGARAAGPASISAGSDGAR